MIAIYWHAGGGSLAVVPIIVNGGAALLPAILAGAASTVSLLLRPKDILNTFKTRPLIPLAIIIGLALAGVCTMLLWRSPAAAPNPARERAARHGFGATEVDWVAIALAKINAPEADPTTRQTTATSAQATSSGLQDMSRSGYGGGASPGALGSKPVWSYLQEGTIFPASPIVRGGRVYGAGCYFEVPNSYGSVFCLDAASGQPIWTVEQLPNGTPFKGIFSSPMLSDDGKSVVVGQGLHEDLNSDLICLDAATGAVRWVVHTPLHVESSPAVEGDVVVVGAGAVERGPDHKPTGDPNGEGHPGMVIGVRISDGTVLWRYTVNDPESSPALHNGIAYIGSGINGNAVVALRARETDAELSAKGLTREVWRAPAPAPVLSAVTLTNDVVLVGSGKGDFVYAAADPSGYLLALNAATGKELWRLTLPDTVLGSIAVHDDRAYVPVRNGELLAINLAEQGRIVWRQRVNGTSPLLAGPAVAGSQVYAVSQDGYLASFDSADGTVLSKQFINDKRHPGEKNLCAGRPFVVDARLYVGSETGGLQCWAGK